MSPKKWAQAAYLMHGNEDATRIARRSSHEWHRKAGVATGKNKCSSFFIECLHWLEKIDKQQTKGK